MAIVAVLAAITFPVMNTAQNAARKAACLENFHSVGLAMQLYMDEYNGRFPPTNYRAYRPTAPTIDPNDRTWVQLVFPYARGGFEIFECPGDTGREAPAHVGLDDDVDSVPDDDWNSFYHRSLRTNLGFNYVYLSPVSCYSDTTGVHCQAYPRSYSEVEVPSGTLTHVDSIWARDRSGGNPVGGGRWAVVPPCQLTSAGINTFPVTNPYLGIAPNGWDTLSSGHMSASFYGGAWPWHGERFSVVFADLHVRVCTIGQLSRGCDRQPLWVGLIYDQASYIWDLKQ